jgi:hypothetical protein
MQSDDAGPPTAQVSVDRDRPGLLSAANTLRQGDREYLLQLDVERWALRP